MKISQYVSYSGNSGARLSDQSARSRSQHAFKQSDIDPKGLLYKPKLAGLALASTQSITFTGFGGGSCGGLFGSWMANRTGSAGELWWKLWGLFGSCGPFIDKGAVGSSGGPRGVFAQKLANANSKLKTFFWSTARERKFPIRVPAERPARAPKTAANQKSKPKNQNPRAVPALVGGAVGSCGAVWFLWGAGFVWLFWGVLVPPEHPGRQRTQNPEPKSPKPKIQSHKS